MGFKIKFNVPQNDLFMKFKSLRVSVYDLIVHCLVKKKSLKFLLVVSTHDLNTGDFLLPNRGISKNATRTF